MFSYGYLINIFTLKIGVFWNKNTKLFSESNKIKLLCFRHNDWFETDQWSIVVTLFSLSERVIYSDRAPSCSNQTGAWLTDKQLSLLKITLIILLWELYLHMKRSWLHLHRAGGTHFLLTGWMSFQLFFIWKPMSDCRYLFFVCACTDVVAHLNISWCFQYLWNSKNSVCFPLWISAQGIHDNLLLFM